jgi:cysteine-rich repeat protein
MNRFGICCVAALCATALFGVPAAGRADTSTVIVDSWVTNGHCNVCFETDYACFNGYPEWHPDGTFLDPTPGGTIVTRVSVRLFGDNCAANTEARVNLNGQLVQQQVDPTPDSCSCGCNGGSAYVSTYYTGGFPGYVYGGYNTVSITPIAGNFCLSYVEVVVEHTSLCGNGVVNGREECDDGNTNPSDGCTNSCTICGNGIVTAPEQCDDGNLIDGDGCDSNCTLTGCGNGIVTAGEQCDDGNLIDGDGCDSNCTPTGCGNGIVTGSEQCDDGNTASNDGCTAGCKLETGARHCQDAIAKAGAGFFAAKLLAIQSCRDAINKGKLYISPAECLTERKTSAAIAKAAGRAQRRLQRTCTDAQVATLAACADTVGGLLDASGGGCIGSATSLAINNVIAAEYGRVLFAIERGPQRCQATIAKAGRMYATAVTKALQKCRGMINDGDLAITPLDCPTEAKTAAAITVAGTRARGRVAANCSDSVVSSIAPCAPTLDGLISPSGNGGCLITTHQDATSMVLRVECGR